jgi:integrase
LNAVSHAELQTLLNDLRRRVLCEVFRKAKHMHLREDDPSEGLEVPRIRRVQKPTLTIKQIRALLIVVAGTRYVLIYEVMVVLGLRIGEALALATDERRAGGLLSVLNCNDATIRTTNRCITSALQSLKSTSPILTHIT